MRNPRTLSATAALSAIALLAFAGNSLLCRLALKTGSIDPAGFTAVRIASGAATLWALTRLGPRTSGASSGGSWISAFWLLLYAAAFSYAYVSLGAGMGALILFGFVQVTLMTIGIRRGERLAARQWLGLGLACGGLVYLVAPGLHAPPLRGAALMAVAGIAWGLYTLRGRGISRPIAATAGNFLRAALPALLLAAVAFPAMRMTPLGAAWATLSGAVTSGMGYAVWYAALRHLTVTRASAAQLLVPILAAFGGVLVLGESVTMRLVLAAAATLGGVILTFRPAPSPRTARLAPDP